MFFLRGGKGGVSVHHPSDSEILVPDNIAMLYTCGGAAKLQGKGGFGVGNQMKGMKRREDK